MPSPVANLAKKMQKRAEILHVLEQVVQADPTLARMIHAALTEHFGGKSGPTADPAPARNGVIVRVRRRERERPVKASGRVERVAEALRAKPWLSTPALREATGLSKVQLGQVLKKYAARFESRPDPEFKRRFQWRTKEASA
ncbi:MAG: hypothetical protein WD749_05085 [Phycisphaerales bacterium]